MSAEEVHYGDWFSNDWLVPLGKEAEPVFDRLPRQQAIDVAASVLDLVDGGNDLPFAVVFPSDNPTEALSRLLATLRTPDEQLPANDPTLRPSIDQLKAVLQSHNLYGISGSHGAYHFIRVAAGNTEEAFSIYTDKARKWPQYSDDWKKKIVEQFGAGALLLNPELSELLEKQELIAAIHSNNPIQRSGENTVNLILRAFESLNIDSVDSMNAANNILERRLDTYRQASYLIRGIPLPNGN